MAVVLLLYLVAEIAAVWAVSSVVGLFGTLGLLVVGALLGSWLARREGVRALRSLMTAAQAGRGVQNEVTDGMLIAFGGVLIMVPGFVSDVAGLVLLVAPTRKLVRRAWLRRAERRMAAGGAKRVIVVDSEVVPDDPRHPVIESQ
ncbi:FxsA family protein [Amycolatopsis pigmentata]|uniref:FxsA family protein n=1 Tax=Amycolatopsis pigmentata TaxID=450801 RepID=A0ABW5FTG3_9PSEU